MTTSIWYCVHRLNDKNEFTIEIDSDNNAIVKDLDEIWIKYPFEYVPKDNYFANDVYRIILSPSENKEFGQVYNNSIITVLLDDFYVIRKT